MAARIDQSSPRPRDGFGFGHWSSLSPVSQRLILLGAAFLLVMMAAVGVAILDMRAVALKEARESVKKLDIAVAEQTARSFEAIDLVLLELRTRIAAQHITTPAAFSAALNSHAVQIELSQQNNLLPQANAFTIVGADGKLINFSRRWPIPPTDLSDRDYYQYFRSHDDPDAFVSQPVRNRGDGRWTLFIVRRIDSPTGTFLGMVLGAIDLGYFQNFYDALTAGEDLGIALLNRNGIVLASSPFRLPVGQKSPVVRPEWRRIVAAGRPTVFEVRSTATLGDRIVSAHPLRDYPLVVDVSVSKSGSLVEWRRQTILTILGAGCAMLCTILLLRAIILQLQRLEQSEASLAEKSSALKTTLDHISQGIMMVNAAGTVAICNLKTIEMLDLPPDLMASQPSLETVLAYKEERGTFVDCTNTDEIAKALRSREAITYERQRPDGRILEVQNVPLPDGGTVHTLTDITARRRSEMQIRHLAHHNSLTQLANRALFKERLEQEIRQVDRTGRRVALLYLDLDRFKFVNDTWGHGAGDALLAEVADRLRAAAPGIETIARTGGDEFAIILPQEADAPEPTLLAAAIIDHVEQPIDVNGAACQISVSVGIARYPDHARGASDLLRNADIALYQAKSDGTGLYRVFDAGMDARQKWLFTLEQDLRQALGTNQFALVYQPIIDTNSGQAVGCEALLRWRHPLHGPIAPAEFIPLAERLGLIVPIGRWVLETACAEAATWPPEMHVAVNLSPVQVNHVALVAEVRDILARTGLPSQRLTLEVTEGILLEESSTVLSTMHELRALGIRFSLDDFGTGHSGLGYLRRFPFDGIKIDQMFVRDMVDQPDAAAIVSALLTVSRELNLEVIAEGVETEAQLNALRRRGTKLVQGLFTGPPMPANEMRARVITRNAPLVS